MTAAQNLTEFRLPPKETASTQVRQNIPIPPTQLCHSALLAQFQASQALPIPTISSCI
jgi:hypothetical protein